METKKCCMCQDDLALNKFKTNSRRKDGLQSQCIDCQKKYRRQHYEKNKQKYIDKADYWRRQFFAWWAKYKRQFKCPCGEDHPACIEFHHTDDNKDANVAELVGLGSKQKVLDEVAKCTPLCSNCHRKLHWERKNHDPNQN